VRVPSKYPGKTHFKGTKRGQPSGNPLGKNPSDVWSIVAHDWETALWNIPNVKANHPEKTIHPCQFPIELVERCVLALTNEEDWVLDPFSGVGSALLAALKNNRRAFGCEKEAEYVQIAHRRINDLRSGALPYRQLGKPVHQPTGREKVAQIPIEWKNAEAKK
jgi:adenine-specific DNA-methyltransferase